MENVGERAFPYDEERKFMSKMSYKGVQAIATELGLPANLKKDDIITLVGLHRGGHLAAMHSTLEDMQRSRRLKRKAAMEAGRSRRASTTTAEADSASNVHADGHGDDEEGGPDREPKQRRVEDDVFPGAEEGLATGGTKGMAPSRPRQQLPSKKRPSRAPSRLSPSSPWGSRASSKARMYGSMMSPRSPAGSLSPGPYSANPFSPGPGPPAPRASGQRHCGSKIPYGDSFRSSSYEMGSSVAVQLQRNSQPWQPGAAGLFAPDRSFRLPDNLSPNALPGAPSADRLYGAQPLTSSPFPAAVDAALEVQRNPPRVLVDLTRPSSDPLLRFQILPLLPYWKPANTRSVTCYDVPLCPLESGVYVRCMKDSLIRQPAVDTRLGYAVCDPMLGGFRSGPSIMEHRQLSEMPPLQQQYQPQPYSYDDFSTPFKPSPVLPIPSIPTQFSEHSYSYMGFHPPFEMERKCQSPGYFPSHSQREGHSAFQQVKTERAALGSGWRSSLNQPPRQPQPPPPPPPPPPRQSRPAPAPAPAQSQRSVLQPDWHPQQQAKAAGRHQASRPHSRPAGREGQRRDSEWRAKASVLAERRAKPAQAKASAQRRPQQAPQRKACQEPELPFSEFRGQNNELSLPLIVNYLTSAEKQVTPSNLYARPADDPSDQGVTNVNPYSAVKTHLSLDKRGWLNQEAVARHPGGDSVARNVSTDQPAVSPHPGSEECPLPGPAGPAIPILPSLFALPDPLLPIQMPDATSSPTTACLDTELTELSNMCPISLGHVELPAAVADVLAPIMPLAPFACSSITQPEDVAPLVSSAHAPLPAAAPTVTEGDLKKPATQSCEVTDCADRESSEMKDEKPPTADNSTPEPSPSSEAVSAPSRAVPVSACQEERRGGVCNPIASVLMKGSDNVESPSVQDEVATEVADVSEEESRGWPCIEGIPAQNSLIADGNISAVELDHRRSSSADSVPFHQTTDHPDVKLDCQPSSAVCQVDSCTTESSGGSAKPILLTCGRESSQDSPVEDHQLSSAAIHEESDSRPSCADPMPARESTDGPDVTVGHRHFSDDTMLLHNDSDFSNTGLDRLPSSDDHDDSNVSNVKLDRRPSSDDHDDSNVSNAGLDRRPSSDNHDDSNVPNVRLDRRPSSDDNDDSNVSNAGMNPRPSSADADLTVGHRPFSADTMPVPEDSDIPDGSVDYRPSSADPIPAHDDIDNSDLTIGHRSFSENTMPVPKDSDIPDIKLDHRSSSADTAPIHEDSDIPDVRLDHRPSSADTVPVHEDSDIPNMKLDHRPWSADTVPLLDSNDISDDAAINLCTSSQNEVSLYSSPSNDRHSSQDSVSLYSSPPAYRSYDRESHSVYSSLSTNPAVRRGDVSVYSGRPSMENTSLYLSTPPVISPDNTVSTSVDDVHSSSTSESGEFSSPQMSVTGTMDLTRRPRPGAGAKQPRRAVRCSPRHALPLRSASALHQQAKNLKPCGNSEIGCEMVLPPAQLSSHELLCQYISVDCPGPGQPCGWQGPVRRLFTHLKEVHRSSIEVFKGTDSKCVLSMPDIYKLQHVFFLREISRKLFVVGVHLNGNNIYATIQHIASSRTVERPVSATGTLEMLLSNGVTHQAVWKGRVMPIQLSHVQLQASGHCLEVSIDDLDGKEGANITLHVNVVINHGVPPMKE